ncbi:unnamed protein product [Arabidopsis halleri]
MTTISDLPKELVEEIISRVPVKSMRAVRFTCKKWNHNNTRLVVWNPYCGQTRLIELRYSYISVKECDTCSYAFGYVEKKNKSCRNHKILRFTDSDGRYNERDNFLCKFLTVNTGPEILLTIESFIIDEEKKVALVLDDHTFYIFGETGYLREWDLGEPAHKKCSTQMCSYVPSLVQIKRPAGSKKKLQSSLEKRRYDQKKLRLVALDKRIKK